MTKKNWEFTDYFSKLCFEAYRTEINQSFVYHVFTLQRTFYNEKKKLILAADESSLFIPWLWLMAAQWSNKCENVFAITARVRSYASKFNPLLYLLKIWNVLPLHSIALHRQYPFILFFVPLKLCKLTLSINEWIYCVIITVVM